MSLILHLNRERGNLHFSFHLNYVFKQRMVVTFSAGIIIRYSHSRVAHFSRYNCAIKTSLHGFTLVLSHFVWLKWRTGADLNQALSLTKATLKNCLTMSDTGRVQNSSNLLTEIL